MKELLEFYNELGISPAVYNYGEAALEKLKEHFVVMQRLAPLVVVIGDICAVLKVYPSTSISLTHHFALARVLTASFSRSISISTSCTVESGQKLSLIAESANLSVRPNAISTLDFLPLEQAEPLDT